MTRSLCALPLWSRLFALSLLLTLVLPPATGMAVPAALELQTRYFTIIYPPGEEKTAEWYAGFADEVDVAVSELLGEDPVEGLTLQIYASESEYQQANPLAGLHPGILAHAIPEQKEIGVAVDRLRQQPPELARLSFRHEMTHIVVGVLSSHNLPLGFNEGFAQYNEMSTIRAEEVVTLLTEAETQGMEWLSWRAMNDRRRFWANVDLAYPQSYTVMAFLAERYGMGKFARFVAQLRDYRPYQESLYIIYERSMDELQSEWRQWLPGFLKDGWRHNVLTAYDMTPGVDLYTAGQYAEARDRLAESETLYRDLGRTARAEEAAAYRAKAAQAQEAADLTTQAQQALEAHEYATAQDLASRAEETFVTLALAVPQAQTQEISSLAGQGLTALAALERARAARQRLDLPQAQQDAHEAGTAFAALGDTARQAEAEAILAELWRGQRIAGLAALAAGLGAVLLAGLVAWYTRRAQRASRPLTLGEETSSWL